MYDVDSLDQYRKRYGRLLAAQAEQSLRPLYVPGRDPLLVAPLLRRPFPAQQHVISAGAKTLRRQKSLLVVGEMGCGKTLLGMGIVHTHAGCRPYRALVFAPGQLCTKWERELRETIAAVQVVQLQGWRDVVKLRPQPCRQPTWYVIARDSAKLGSKWRPAYFQGRQGHPKSEQFLRCPRCHARLVKDTGDDKAKDESMDQDGLNLDAEALAKKRLFCRNPVGKNKVCGEAALAAHR